MIIHLFAIRGDTLCDALRLFLSMCFHDRAV
jgi:hypothetical protein